MKKSRSAKELTFLEDFCTLCYEIALKYEEQKLATKGLSKEEKKLKSVEFDIRAKELRHNHPKCKYCELLFGPNHLAYNSGDNICQYCKAEISQGLFPRRTTIQI